MKKISALVAALVVALALLGGCGAGSASGSGQHTGKPDPSGRGAGRLNVVATIFPPYDFVREVAGDDVELTMLLPPGAESHSYEPTPQDIITIQNCDVFIHAGGESDAWIEDILASMDTGGMTILAMMDMVEVKAEEMVEGMEEDADDHAGEHDGHAEEEPELDEHVWTSPKNAMLIAQGIADTLCALDAEHADAWRQSTAAYLEELETLDEAFAQAVAGGARNTLIFGDRFPFRYLVDEYGLRYYAAFPGCSTQSEPSAATVAFLIDKVNEEHIPAVFHIEFSNEKMADTICGETGAKKLLLHSCHNVTRAQMEDGATYLSLMTQNVEALREALA